MFTRDNNSDVKWAIKGSNIRFYLESSHPFAYKKLIETFPVQNLVKKENVDEALPLASKKSNIKAITVDSILTHSLEKRLSTMTLDEAKHAGFDPVTYKTLFLAYLTANNLTFAHSDSPALATLLAYVNNCELDELRLINRHSMRMALNFVCRDSVNDIKDKLIKHKGKFALNLDEWKSGNNFEFSHYHDSDFKMRKYATGFKVLNKDVSYTGEVLYKHLDNVLTDYNIKDRITSITRDKASSINSLVTKFKASLVNEKDVGEFSGYLRFSGIL